MLLQYLLILALSALPAVVQCMDSVGAMSLYLSGLRWANQSDLYSRSCDGGVREDCSVEMTFCLTMKNQPTKTRRDRSCSWVLKTHSLPLEQLVREITMDELGNEMGSLSFPFTTWLGFFHIRIRINLGGRTLVKDLFETTLQVWKYIDSKDVLVGDYLKVNLFAKISCYSGWSGLSCARRSVIKTTKYNNSNNSMVMSVQNSSTANLFGNLLQADILVKKSLIVIGKDFLSTKPFSGIPSHVIYQSEIPLLPFYLSANPMPFSMDISLEPTVRGESPLSQPQETQVAPSMWDISLEPTVRGESPLLQPQETQVAPSLGDISLDQSVEDESTFTKASRLRYSSSTSLTSTLCNCYVEETGIVTTASSHQNSFLVFFPDLVSLSQTIESYLADDAGRPAISSVTPSHKVLSRTMPVPDQAFSKLCVNCFSPLPVDAARRESPVDQQDPRPESLDGSVLLRGWGLLVIMVILPLMLGLVMVVVTLCHFGVHGRTTRYTTILLLTSPQAPHPDPATITSIVMETSTFHT